MYVYLNCRMYYFFLCLLGKKNMNQIKIFLVVYLRFSIIENDRVFFKLEFIECFENCRLLRRVGVKLIWEIKNCYFNFKIKEIDVLVDVCDFGVFCGFEVMYVFGMLDICVNLFFQL